MATKTKGYTLAVVLVILVSLWVLFQPVRYESKQAAIPNKLEFKTGKDLTEGVTPADQKKALRELEKKLQKDLESAGLFIDKLEIIPPDTVRITTLAESEEEFAKFHESAKAALAKQYPDLKDLSYKYTQQTGTVIARVGPFVLYKPRLHLKLGLDLRGGSHVLLQCVPKAEFQIEAKSDLASDVDGREALREALIRKLTAEGIQDVSVEVPDARHIVVRTHPKTNEEATHEQQIITAFLNSRLGKDNFSIQPEVVVLDATTLNMVKNIIEQRVNSLGLTEPIVQTQGRDRVIVEMPGIDNPEDAINMIGKTASLEFRAVPLDYVASEDPGTGQVIFERNGEEVDPETVMAQSPVIVTGADLKNNVHVQKGRMGKAVVAFEIKPRASKKFAAFTRQAAAKEQYLAIVFDGKVISAPVVKHEIIGKGVIEGMDTLKEAHELALLLNAGALPVPVKVAEVRTVSATLGADSIARSLKAGLVGLLLVGVFMIAYYRLPGIMATVALTIYLILDLAALVALGATLTLPGIAGFVMTIGMAVDANVLIFERLKEELRTDKSLKMALDVAFHRAWTAILDGHVTTFLVGVVLYMLATGTVKGFAVTLLVGIVCNLFTAMIVTRLLMNGALALPIGKRKVAYGVSE